ncbi:helix-turn-helix transcriptional regulator [Nocardia sp. NBC_01499]|uniref:helix-turn-helix transcriptional regulator n=1 Tax=Nocardia sp. NBC_01499 TaxID=2903597 RepID=UPI00386B718D
MSDHIADSIRYMWDNCGQQISLDELAGIAKYSKFYFVRKFRSETRCSPVRFLSAVRLARSKQLLADTSTNVYEISQSVGYMSYGTFTSRFTEAVGLSPSRYRRYVRGERASLGWEIYGADSERPHDMPSLTIKLFDGNGDTVRRAYVGIFSTATPVSSAAALLIVENRDVFSIDCLPPGRWISRVITSSRQDSVDCGICRDLHIGSCEFQLRKKDRVEIDITLTEQTIRTPPFLPALPAPLSDILTSSIVQ